jgi:hypothetical protein
MSFSTVSVCPFLPDHPEDTDVIYPDDLDDGRVKLCWRVSLKLLVTESMA